MDLISMVPLAGRSAMSAIRSDLDNRIARVRVRPPSGSSDSSRATPIQRISGVNLDLSPLEHGAAGTPAPAFSLPGRSRKPARALTPSALGRRDPRDRSPSQRPRAGASGSRPFNLLV